MTQIAKASQVLDCFSAAEPRLGLAQIAARTGLPKPTAHRVLRGLREAGLIVQDGRRDAYRLGLRLLSLGGVVLSDLDVPRHAAGPAEALMNRSGEAVHVCVFDGRNVVAVDRHEMAETRNEVVRLEREPPWCTGTGKAVLAALPEARAAALLDGPLERFTPNTLTDRDALFRDLARTRARGYALDDEERQPGVRCVGAALRRRMEVVGAISVTGPKHRFQTSRLPHLAELVSVTAAQIGLAIERG